MTDKDNSNSTKKTSAPSSEVERISQLVAEIKNQDNKSIKPISNDTREVHKSNSKSTHESINTSSSEEKINKDFNAIYSKIKNDLDCLITSYLEKSAEKPLKNDVSRSEIISEFDKIIKNIPPTHSEINIHAILSNSDAKKVRDLFVLLEHEIASKTKKLKLDELPKSHSKKIHQKNLEEIFEELGDKIIEESERENTAPIEEEILPPSFYDEIPHPTFSRIFFAFIIDISVFALLDVLTLSKYKNSELTPDSILELVLGNIPLVTGTFFVFWFFIQSVSLVLTQSTIGQSLLRVIVATKENTSPNILRLLSRLSLHFFNFISLGLYSNLIIKLFWAKDQKGFYCPISKTKLTFKGFIRQ